MARFHGAVGFGVPVEVRPGVWKEQITEKSYFGDEVLTTRRLLDSEKVNPDISVDNSISIVADAFANENILAMRYVKWAGAYWIVSSVQVQRPRLVLRLGGMYAGPKA